MEGTLGRSAGTRGGMDLFNGRIRALRQKNGGQTWWTEHAHTPCWHPRLAVNPDTSKVGARSAGSKPDSRIAGS
jgi:hypothetical protein